MTDDLRAVSATFDSGFAEASTLDAVGRLETEFLGRNGRITALLKSLKSVPAESRPAAGKAINDLRNAASEKLAAKKSALESALKAERLKSEAIDVTLALARPDSVGALHPLTQTRNALIRAFVGLGFSVREGPEIERDYYNFQLMNIPPDHPSRDAQDTFYVTDDILLRTQTSAVQARVMLEEKPPIRIICPGKVYRADDDATHSPMFHQMEGLVVEEKSRLSMRDLKGVLDEFARAFFGADARTRLRPSYFPFTEPSVETDVSCFMCKGAGCKLCKGTGWIEILGAGIVNPAVLENCGIDSGTHRGYAFGIGIERCAMLKYGIPDIRMFFENDLRFLRQFI